MSRIYEALNRAANDTAASTETLAKMLSPLRVTKSASRDHLSLAGENETCTAFDLSQLNQVAWNPQLSGLPALQERGSTLEQFRGLRSHLREFRDLNNVKTIMVSSGLPKEGKSFVSANLAISFARHKSARVLLIDGDMRRSSLHKLFGTSHTPGLTEYLSGEAGITEVIQRAKPSEEGGPIPKGLSSLFFLPSGADADNAAELSGSPRFAELLQQVTPLFDWIIVDSSPVNLVSDGVNLARHCDAVLLVARSGVTEFKAAQRAVAELKASTILGFVLNAVDDVKSTSSYYGYDSSETKA
jgi:protein-tyrosine kinase